MQYFYTKTNILLFNRFGNRFREDNIKSACKFLQALDAERTGFEPVKPFRGLHAFQACLFNHSSIFPNICV